MRARWAACLTGLACFLLAVCASFATADEPTLTLRIAWGGGAERTWRGNITLSAGKLSNPQPLDLEPDEAGSIWVNDAGAVEVRGPSTRTYDGVDVEVRADLSAKLLVAMAADGEPLPQPVAIELSKLVKEPHFGELDDKKNRLLVRRAPGDALRVSMRSPNWISANNRPDNGILQSLVLRPSERMDALVKPHLLGDQAAGTLYLRTQLQVAREKRELWNREQEVSAPSGQPVSPTSVEIQAPAEPGVYDVIFTVYPKGQLSERLLPIAGRRELLSRLGQRGEPLAERRVQFIVIADTNTPAAKRPGPPNTELMTINPAKTWWERVAHMPRIPGLGKDPLEFGAIERWEHPKLGPLVLLKSGPGLAPKLSKAPDSDADETWVAYPLTVSQPGQVHIVEVEYPSDVPQAMNISIVEPNASGSVVPIGLDSGVYVPPEGAQQLPRQMTHRVAFWPRTREPLLVISRIQGAPRAAHGRIRLLGPKRYGVGMIRLPMDAHSALSPAAVSAADSQRLVIGMMERPLFPENFGAAESFDAWSGGSLDDWTTFYDGGRRMLEYSQHVGYNALIVAALADGSTIYPSARLAPTPRYDSGAFFSTGQDPVRKDVLEMLMRMSNREGMLLIPLLQFSAPLPELEAVLRRGGTDTTGIQLVGGTGATWMERYGSRRGQSAYYNPLDPRVQQAMRNVVRELVARYGQHRAFGGVALGSSGPCFTLMPGVEWGLDDVTFDRFCRDKEVTLAAVGPARFAARAKAVAGPHRQAWLQWRAEVMHTFHAQLRSDLAAAKKDTRLFVTTGGMLQGPDAEAALRPALPPRMKMEDLPLAAGVRPDLYRGDEGIVLLRPRLVSTPVTSRTAAVDLPVGDSPDLDGVFRDAASSGNLFVHSPVRARLATFDARSPFGAEKTYHSMVTHLATAEPESRRRFVQALRGLDSPLLVDGGWMFTLGEERSLTPLFLAFRRLPVGDYQDVSGETQGLTCRWITREGETYLYVLNPTPWACRASLTVRGDEKAKLTELSGLREQPKRAAGGVALALEPYDLLAIKFSGQPDHPGGAPAVTFASINVTFDPQIREALYQRLRDLVRRTSLLAEPRRISVLSNPEFELAGDGQREVAGWTLAGGTGAQAAVDSEIKHEGRASARLSSRGGVASLISDPFNPPQTGRVSVAVRLRTSADGAAPTLRLALGGKLEGADYYRFAEAPVDATWRYFIFTVDNLPLDGLSDLQVRFDLMGAGQAWIDDVVVSDMALSENERAELSRIVTRAQFSLEDGRLADCARLLESYWPRFLEENVALPQADVAAGDRPLRTASNPDGAAPVNPPGANPPWWKRGLPSVFR